MKTNHNFYLDLAFNLAENNLGKTNLNPSVGCIITKNKSVISSGTTSIKGRPHAEFNALNKNIDFKDSTMYVTLEPCSHHGLTPPCTKLIGRKKIKKVFFCHYDPDSRSYKKAKKNLKKLKINLIQIKSRNKDFYKSYYLNKRSNLPLVDGKIAISKDFFTINKRLKWITNYRSRTISHLLRSRYDTIVSTSRSINADNSLLNCRINGLNKYKPDLIIIDRKLKLKKKLKLFNITNKRKTYIFTSSQNTKKIKYFKNKNCKIVKINNLEDEDDFKFFLKILFKLGKRRVLVESGLTFLNYLLKYKMINELFVFKSGIMLKKDGMNNSHTDFIKNFYYGKSLQVNLLNDKLFKIKTQ